MSDIRASFAGCGERGERGERGKRGRIGPTGPTGATGATGSTGPAGLTGATGSTGPANVPNVLAAATIGPTGYVANFGFTGTVGNPSAGVFNLMLANPPPNLTSDMVVTALLQSPAAGVGGQITMSGSTNPNIIQITTFNSVGVPTNFPFNVTVVSLV